MRFSKFFLIGFILLFIQFSLSAQKGTPLRRPTSTTSPMWIIHIDTWNWADPEKIIDLVPEDIRPFVVFNVSLSVSDFVIKKYPFSICESWIRTCAEKGVWVMIQPASGYKCNLPYSYSEEYEYFYKNYPNFIGYNFAEQNWGFPSSNEFQKRLDLFIELLKLADTYGGYLSVSNFMGVGNYTNPIGQFKNHPAFEQACKKYSRNYILQDKFTFPTGFYDNESAHLGAFLSGYSDHYGIRFDECGWRATSGEFAESSGIAAVMEHFLLTGATVTDGPETIPMQATRQISSFTNRLGYTEKRWEMYPQMIDIHVDIFRKIIDGTFRIPSRDEVIERTKIAYVNDLTQGTNLQKYSSNPSLFTDLYAMDGALDNNKTWFKKTGRYPSIPMMHKYSDELESKFDVVVRESSYASRWPNLQTKVNTFNALFPSEYTGDGFAARIKNTWLTYNPYMNTNVKSTAIIPLKYNSCDSISLNYSQFSNGIINEYPDKFHIYLNNYCTDASYGIREDVITIYGSTNKPTFQYTDRGRVKSTVSEAWNDGIFVLTIQHNGPLDLDIQCSGTATDRLTDCPPSVTMIAPSAPPVYYGSRQYEAENFDIRNIGSVSETNLQNYSAMGYLTFGSNSGARTMETVTVLQSGNYDLYTKYKSLSANVTSIDLYVNRIKVANPIFTKTPNDNRVWEQNVQNVYLNQGVNTIEFRAKAPTYSFYIDNIIIAKSFYDFTHDKTSDQAIDPSFITVRNGSIGIVNYDNKIAGSGNCLKTYSVDSISGTGVANLDLLPESAENYIVIWKEYSAESGGLNGVLLRGGSSAHIPNLKQGYLFASTNETDNSITLKTYKTEGDAITEKTSFHTNVTSLPGEPRWFRASAVGNQMMFEYSVDSITWFGGTETVFTDDTHRSGSTQLVWGLGTGNSDWTIDNIDYKSASISLLPEVLTELNYVRDQGPSNNKSFVLSANSLMGDVTLIAPNQFEISFNETNEYANTLSLTPQNGMLTSRLVYARLKANLASGVYTDTLVVHSAFMEDQKLVLSGEVENKPLTKTYSFESDRPGTFATTPPAKNVTIGQGNTATAGVVTYSDKNGNTSNVLKPFRGGQRESTGILDLNLFSKQATNYSVTWKQLLGSDTDNYKIGVVLRGDSTRLGDGTLGYVNGMMHGYVFIAYTNRGSNNTEFRIYKSTSGNGLETYANVSTNNVRPTIGQPVWFRASVSGNAIVYLTFDYSLDGNYWTNVANYTDKEASYLSGATQLVWGLGAGSVNFYYDDITYFGVALNEDELPAGIEKTNMSTSTVVSEQYFNLFGQPIHSKHGQNAQGIYLIRSHMSDGSINVRKVYIK